MAKQRDKQGLRPVQDVVGRLRFDATFDVRRFVVGYEERFAGVREAPLADFFAGDNEIPWHRIFFIKAGELIVWDRRSRIDLVFGSGDSPAPDHAAIARACAPAPVAAPTPTPTRRSKARTGPALFVTRPCFRFDPLRGAWLPVATAGLHEARVEALQVATYNVLFDLYEPEQLYSEARAPVCSELLRERDADIIALQEVTPRLWAELLAAPWLRAGYYVSEGPDAEGLQPYGQVLLSRWPLALELHEFSARKRLVVGRLSLAGRRLAVAAVHLTSNRKADADDRRAEQLAVLVERLGRADVDDALVLGDLNFGDGEEDQQLARAGLVDVWREVHPHHPGFTFDPQANPLAALATRTGKAARFDRALLRSPAGALAPIDAALFGDKPFGTGPGGQELFASDHFGVCALLQVVADADAAARRARLAAASPVHRSALVVIPPAQAWPPIEAIRAEHDPSHGRWMPHINLVYGFVPEALFADAAAALTTALRGLLPLRIALKAVRRFDHRGSTTVWLEPVSDPPGALMALQAAAAALFPLCDEQSSRGPGFLPHLTIAKLTGSEAEIAAAIARWQASWRPLEFTVEAVHLISRREDEPFAIRATVPTCPEEQADAEEPGGSLPPFGRWPSPAHERVTEAFARATAAVRAGSQLHVVGSARLGVAQPDGDLDLVWAGEDGLDREALFAAVTERLAAAGELHEVRTVKSAGLPVLKCRFEGIAVDLQYAGLPAPLQARALGSLRPDELATLDEASRRAALGCVDADALVLLVGDYYDSTVFRETLARVRRWARARQLDAGAWGLLGGYTWAIVTAWAMRAAGEAGVAAEPEALLRHFFMLLAARTPGAPIAFAPPPEPRGGRKPPWPIWTPTPPPFNSARHVTRSTLALLHAELRRGHALASAGDPAVVAAVDPAGHPRRVELTLVGVAEAPARCVGWLEGHVMGLLLALEDAGARVRPYPRPLGAGAARWAIGLEGGESPAIEAASAAFAASFAAWAERPEGAELQVRLVE
ncbi:Poly(A) polymerase central domain-containing protein [Nannocystis exedens]|uniref:Poly(A) polymerase central domain-containing protein n=1 Tax=Nannocystis exedens TaxID=54 RepID=A0A1I2E567_9BACT|nr:poly(A) polymerase [Nannocystis exedens]PCC69260.1 Endonuclease/Exonuclease/phosphatase family protein [Nannocystis exedens]SFE87400.1 Poly(A) polymerase central domain-containing protein [Nannocystis exedens]